MEKFKALGLNEDILASIEKKGFKEPSPVQAEVIPVLIDSNRDVIAMAQTGTGKTAAFGLPICQHLTATGVVKALVICPTRELAVQVCDEMKSFISDRNFRILPVYGGQPFHDQKRALQRGVDVVVGTPGRLIDAIKRNVLDMTELEYIVLDEVDEMMNMGFIEDIEFILDQTPKDCQRLMFSATLAPRIEKIAKNKLDNPLTFKIAKSEDTANLIDHIYYETDQRNRLESLTRIMTLEEDLYGIIFCQTKADTENLASELNSQGVTAEYLHGDIAQSSREKILKRFKDKKCNLLVATDVAARGIDVDNLTHVINYSVPDSTEAYTHRCGRTGRKGNTGKAITLCLPSEFGRFNRIKNMTKFTMTKVEVPDGEKIAKIRLKQFKNKLDENTPTELNIGVAKDLLADSDPVEVLSKVLQLYAGKAFDPEAYKIMKKASHPSSRSGKAETTVRLSKGTNDDFNGKSIIQFIEKKSGIPNRLINGLNLKRDYCTFKVPTKDAEAVINKLNRRVASNDSRPMARVYDERPRGGGGGGRRRERRDRRDRSDRGRRRG
ncbi:MAG: DEAD/DEAH box helicase [Lentisphaeraceae bacterium]|nr:DEAD/DEAH box helicase [Lentisphaeraceae bacterium]